MLDIEFVDKCGDDFEFDVMSVYVWFLFNCARGILSSDVAMLM